MYWLIALFIIIVRICIVYYRKYYKERIYILSMKKTQTLEVETAQSGMTMLEVFENIYPNVEANSNEEAMDFLLNKESADGDRELCDALEEEMVAEDRRKAKILLSEVKE